MHDPPRHAKWSIYTCTNCTTTTSLAGGAPTVGHRDATR